MKLLLCFFFCFFFTYAMGRSRALPAKIADKEGRQTPTVTRNIRPGWNECAWFQADHNHDNDDAHSNRAIGGEWARGRRRWWSDDVGELYWGSRLTAKDERSRTKLGFWMFFPVAVWAGGVGWGDNAGWNLEVRFSHTPVVSRHPDMFSLPVLGG
jgi:hypothetical protein